ncbi:integrase core domain-containing protein [Paenibacillus sp. Leaf72]|uniref:integrase core domain-containing protein n=1 Tax=Paenibacillus sp. Leaf72 TaxID=1736234 RepID=UPI00138F4C5D
MSKGEPLLFLRTDIGPQFISKAFHAYCEQAGVEHERIPPRTPNKNAFIESFHSILERECTSATERRSLCRSGPFRSILQL